MKERTLEFSYKARFYTLGELNASTKQVWFVLHGYGQLARYFGKKFEKLSEHNCCVVVPEGLSRFYLEAMEKRVAGGENRVGATWMTAENRLMDIENYLLYLDSVYQHILNTKADVPVTILGFSQGAATASRWAIATTHKFDRLILWSGVWPPDMDFKTGNQVLADKSVALVYGSQDPFLTESRIIEMHELTKKLGLHPDVINFDGAHEIDEQTLLSFM